MGGPVKRRAPAEICPYVNEGSRPPQPGNMPRCARRQHQKKKRGEESSPRRKSIKIFYDSRRSLRINPSPPIPASKSKLLAGSGTELDCGTTEVGRYRLLPSALAVTPKTHVDGVPGPNSSMNPLLVGVSPVMNPNPSVPFGSRFGMHGTGTGSGVGKVLSNASEFPTPQATAPNWPAPGTFVNWKTQELPAVMPDTLNTSRKLFPRPSEYSKSVSPLERSVADSQVAKPSVAQLLSGP
jgi:hypothetical protein